MSCNGNNSVRNQETIDADSIATVDTTVTPPMEEKTTPKEESKTINKVSKNARVKIRLLESIIVVRVVIDIF